MPGLAALKPVWVFFLIKIFSLLYPRAPNTFSLVLNLLHPTLLRYPMGYVVLRFLWMFTGVIAGTHFAHFQTTCLSIRLDLQGACLWHGLYGPTWFVRCLERKDTDLAPPNSTVASPLHKWPRVKKTIQTVTVTANFDTCFLLPIQNTVVFWQVFWQCVIQAALLLQAAGKNHACAPRLYHEDLQCLEASRVLCHGCVLVADNAGQRRTFLWKT